MTRQCVCELCNCGRHRCPHQPTGLFEQSEQPRSVTEYAEKYPEYEGVHPPQSMKPKQEYKAGRDLMDGTTTFKSDYIPFEVTRRPGRVQQEYKPGSGHIDLGTTYKLDYNPYKVQAFVAARPKEKLHATGAKLDTMPTYKDDFRAWEFSKRELTKPEPSYRPSSSKFANLTTFQNDFAPKGLVPRESFKPPNMARLSDAPFDSLTSHRISYIPHQLGVKYVKPKEDYKPSDQPFEDLTIHRRDFQGLPGELSKSCKPDFSKVASDARFDGSTEFRDRFQQWPVTLPKVHKLPEYVTPEGHMDLSTTSNMDYVGHKVQPFIPKRPISRGRRSSVPFQGNTTMKEDFRKWEIRKPEMIKNKEEMGTPTGKFDGLSTFQAHYIPHQLNPVQSFKPQNAAMRNLAPFYDGTMYRTEYTSKKPDLCPASFQDPPGYVFDDVDHRGHKYFHKMLTPLGSKSILTNGIPVLSEVAVMS